MLLPKSIYKMKEVNKLFPNKEAFIIFSLYIILFVFQGTYTQKNLIPLHLTIQKLKKTNYIMSHSKFIVNDSDSQRNTITYLIYAHIFTGVFITASKTENGGYDYNTTLVVFFSELLKLLISATLYTYKRE